MSLSSLFFNLFSIKYGALVALVLQNTFLVVFMHYSRVTDGPMYASSTAVTSMEVMKFVTCLFVVAYQTGGVHGLITSIRDEVINKPMEMVKLSVPSLVYMIQNNLLYYAITHLDAATYQVGYQSKILTTAVFSLIILKKRLSLLQWVSLVILTVGVALAQLSSAGNSDMKSNTTMGFIAILVAAVMSGFAGVYFEFVLKNSGTSLWVRNIQMGFSSIILALFGVYFSGDWERSVRPNGFFYGYNNLVVMVIMLQAVGGLVVAVVVKYADNILKGFAASFSIVTSCILSYFMFDFHPTGMLLVGAVLVNVSMYLYSYEAPTKDIKRDTSNAQLQDKELSNGHARVPLGTSDRMHTERAERAERAERDVERGGGNHHGNGVHSRSYDEHDE